ncbi:MAG: hypothetical protein JRJ64_12440 [Deltaproteobacteria bacterium]|nr:hypothetical protein [Deltaproteobacteria bacterium]
MSRFKGSDEIEARVVDEIELVDMHVKLTTRRDLLEGSSEPGERDKRCCAVEMQLDAFTHVDALDVEVRQ